MSLDLIVFAGLFIVSVSVAIGLSLFVLTVILRMQHKHRRRLARVGRRRMSGRLDLEEARMTLLRQKQESNLVVRLTDALARFIPRRWRSAPSSSSPAPSSAGTRSTSGSCPASSWACSASTGS